MSDTTTLAYRMALPAVARLYADNILNEPAIPPLLREMADEIERLRFTDKEREAIEWVTAGESPFVEEEQQMAVLRGFLARCSCSGGERDNTKG